MSVLLDLKRFIACKSRPDEAHEVLEHVIANAETYAPAFGVAPERLMIALCREETDDQIVRLLVGSIKAAGSKSRQQRAEGRALSAQESADVLGGACAWEGDRALVDVTSLVASVLTKPGALLVFCAEGLFEVAVYMKPLLGLAKLKKPDLAGWVDATGLHVRWNGGRGGLDLRHQIDRDADRIVVNLGAQAEVALAA